MRNHQRKATAEVSFPRELVAATAEHAKEALARAGVGAEALVGAWVEAKNAAAVAAVARDDGVPGAARKAARRGLSILKARGVEVPEPRHVARFDDDTIEGHEAWLVPPDGSASSLVMIAARHRNGRHRVARIVTRRGAGLLEIAGLEMSRTQLKGMLDDTARRTGFRPSTVPVAWARARVAAAKDENAASGAVLPLGLDTHADLLGPAPDAPPPHPALERALSLPSREEAVRASGNLHREPELATWLPPQGPLEALLFDIGQRLAAEDPAVGAASKSRTGPGAASGAEAGEGGGERAPDPTKIDAAVAAALDAATDRYFSPEARLPLAESLKDVAVSLLSRGAETTAALALAVAEAVAAAGLITSPPHEIPFLRAFFQKGLALLAQASGGQLSIPVPSEPSTDRADLARPAASSASSDTTSSP